MVRVFNYIDADTLKQCQRPEWPALLHNLCYLHGAVRLRARYGRGGWNVPQSLVQIGLQEAMVRMYLTVNICLVIVGQSVNG